MPGGRKSGLRIPCYGDVVCSEVGIATLEFEGELGLTVKEVQQ